MFKLGQSIYFQRIGKGVYKIEDGQDYLVFDDEIVKNDEVINIFQNGKDFLILTQNNGLYSSINNSLVKSKIISNEFLSTLSFYNGIRLRDNSFVLGTISNGLIYLNEQGELIYKIDQNTGLLNNTVLSIFEDVENNIWLGLDNGISYVNINSPFEVFTDRKGVVGSVYTSTIHNGNLYLGTNQGLFYKSFQVRGDFNIVKGTKGQVWTLQEIDGTLFCGHNSGTFIVSGNQVKKISDIPGAWGLGRINSNPNYLLQGNYDGLYILEKSNNSWKLKNKIQGFNNSSRYFETLGNKIFVNHEYDGVFELKADSYFTQIENVSIDTLIKGANSGIIKYKGDLLYSYNKGIFKYDVSNQEFIKDSLLSTVYSENQYESGKLILDEKEDILWIFTKENISYVSPSGLSNTQKINSIPLTKEKRNGILGYENITRLDDEGTYLIGTTLGYITVNINAPKIKEFQIHIDNVNSGSNIIDKNWQNMRLQGDFKSKENNLEISFYAPEYNKYVSTNYQFQLTGINDNWSNWSESSTASFNNLPFGDYTFNVRAKIGDTISNNIDSYSFIIKRPWYYSNWAILSYILSACGLIIIIHKLYKSYYKKQQDLIIEDNLRKEKRKELKSKKKMVQIKNEKLKLDIESKNRELAISTMSIIKKNEFLNSIKDQLKEVENTPKVKSVIKTINRNINNTDDWKFFQEAFNNADKNFLKKVKGKHPELTPNDLKLCAYLKLNLSSKEIAPLLNISVRSVEVKRYRLRKKMSLPRDYGLSDYILSL
jgi:DNA-binding CsgD family transcriptional regulator